MTNLTPISNDIGIRDFSYFSLEYSSAFYNLNIAQNKLKLTPNDCKFDPDSKNRLRLTRKRIFGKLERSQMS